MATLLGTANLTTTASTTIDAVSLVTDDLTKSTSTGFRRPIAASILDPGNIPAGTGQSDERPLFREETDKFLALGYFDDDYISGDAESVDIIDGVIYCAYDFLEIDPKTLPPLFSAIDLASDLLMFLNPPVNISFLLENLPV